MADAVRRADELSDELNAFRLDQFSDPANPEMHRRTTAEEIWQQTGGRVDVFVSAVGTGGTLIASVAPQSFNVTLPAMISNGVPQAGAGNLETAASEDQYRFTTTSAGSVKLAFSTCSAALGTVSWALVNAVHGRDRCFKRILVRDDYGSEYARGLHGVGHGQRQDRYLQGHDQQGLSMQDESDEALLRAAQQGDAECPGASGRPPESAGARARQPGALLVRPQLSRVA